jgi:hypothetical protein
MTAWSEEQCCLCGERASEDPALVVRIGDTVVGYLCNDAHATGTPDPALSRMFVDWVRSQHPGRSVVVEIPARGYSYTLDPATA